MIGKGNDVNDDWQQRYPIESKEGGTWEHESENGEKKNTTQKIADRNTPPLKSKPFVKSLNSRKSVCEHIISPPSYVLSQYYNSGATKTNESIFDYDCTF